VVATLNTISAAPNADGVYSTNSTFTLPSGYGATTLSAPTSIYLRAGAQDVIASSASSGTEQVTISSSSGGGTVADEDGLQVVVGRLQVSNAFGSELLKLAVPLNAQYWSDTSWDNNIGDDASQLSAPVQGLFTNCVNKLSSGAPGPNNCQLLSVQSAPPNLTGGAATIYLAPPGRGNVGSGMMSISHGNPAWLPSTSARVVFGTNKSPLIYIREVY
jgi:hypothetical protein